MKRYKAPSSKRCSEAKELLDDGTLSPTEACGRLFSVGYDLDLDGQHEEADSIYQQTIELIEDLKGQPGSSLTDHSLAQLAFGHGKALIAVGKYRSAISAFRRALEIIESSLGSGSNSILLERRAMVLGWLALAQRKSGLMEDSCDTYEQSIALWQRLPEMLNAPTNPYGGFLGACLLGFSKSLTALGKTSAADDYRRQAQALLEAEFEDRLH